jgi:hypothetical protein
MEFNISKCQNLCAIGAPVTPDFEKLSHPSCNPVTQLPFKP